MLVELLHVLVVRDLARQAGGACHKVRGQLANRRANALCEGGGFRRLGRVNDTSESRCVHAYDCILQPTQSSVGHCTIQTTFQ